MAMAMTMTTVVTMTTSSMKQHETKNMQHGIEMAKLQCDTATVVHLHGLQRAL
jgi:hypothetical protein